jgi:hypothetical protein
MNEYNKHKNGHCFKDKDLNPTTCSFSKKCKPGQIRNSEFKCVKDNSKQAYVIRINELIIKINNGEIRKSDATRMLNLMRKQMEKNSSINISHELDSLEDIIKKKYDSKSKKEKVVQNQPVETNTSLNENKDMNNQQPNELQDKDALIKLLMSQINDIYSKLENESISKDSALEEIKLIEDIATKNNVNINNQLKLLKRYVQITFTNVIPNKSVKNNNTDKKLKKIKEIEDKIRLNTRRSTITRLINLLKDIVTPENKLNTEIERLTKLLNNTQPLKRPKTIKSKYTVVNDNEQPVEYNVQKMPDLNEMSNELSPNAFTSKQIRKFKNDYKKKYSKSKKHKKVVFANEVDGNLQFKLPKKSIQSSLLPNTSRKSNKYFSATNSN